MCTPRHRHRVLLACVALLIAGATAFWMLTHNSVSTAAQTLAATVSTESVEETFAGPGVIAPAATPGYPAGRASTAASGA